MLSYTRISTYQKCPKLFEYKYVQGRLPAPTEKMLEGLEEHLKIASVEDVPEFFRSAFMRNFPNPVFEERLSFDFLTFTLQGVIDCYSVNDVFCSIADWKLFQIPESDDQLKIYALLLSKKYTQLTFFQAYFVSLKGEFFKRFTYSIEDIQDFEKQLFEVADEIQTAKEFLPRPGQHCGFCPFIKDCYAENQIQAEIVKITTLDEAIEISKKLYIAENFLKQVKEQLKEFLLEQGLDELVFDEENRVYLSPSIALRFGKTNGKSKTKRR